MNNCQLIIDNEQLKADGWRMDDNSLDSCSRSPADETKLDKVLPLSIVHCQFSIVHRQLSTLVRPLTNAKDDKLSRFDHGHTNFCNDLTKVPNFRRVGFGITFNIKSLLWGVSE